MKPFAWPSRNDHLVSRGGNGERERKKEKERKRERWTVEYLSGRVKVLIGLAYIREGR